MMISRRGRSRARGSPELPLGQAQVPPPGDALDIVPQPVQQLARPGQIFAQRTRRGQPVTAQEDVSRRSIGARSAVLVPRS